MKKRKLAGGTPGNGDVISAKGIYLDMQLGEATYSDICAEGRDSIKPRSIGLDRDGHSYEDRREAARVDATGKYEPKLTENGIPDEVLAKLLPGDDVIELSEPTIAGGIGYRFAKRAFDIVSCGCALILLAIPMGVIALKIKLESPGPVIYAQRRVGKNGKIFNVYKFRSMYVDAEKRGAQWAQGDDPRVTPFGKVMRKTRMDEIPQFWNVLKGDMSAVGPRPTADIPLPMFARHPHRCSARLGVSGRARMSLVSVQSSNLPERPVVEETAAFLGVVPLCL